MNARRTEDETGEGKCCLSLFPPMKRSTDPKVQKVNFEAVNKGKVKIYPCGYAYQTWILLSLVILFVDIRYNVQQGSDL
jgi:hypothetical protein